MEIRYCPSCGTARQQGGIFCASCGNRLGNDAAPTSPFLNDFPSVAPNTQWPSPVVTSTSNESLLKVLRILVALSPLLAMVVLADDWYWIENIRLIWLFCVFPPALMVIIPVLGRGKLLGIGFFDDRFTLMSAFAALFVAARASGALIQGWYTDSGIADLSQVLGLLGFVVFAVSFPWKKPLRSWFAPEFSPIHISISTTASIIFALSAIKDGWFFVFSPVSISGPHYIEYLFVALLVATGFMASPWRQCVAIPIGIFSIMSQIANVMFASGPVRIFPNLTTFACCVALCFPWEDMADKSRKSF